MMRRPPAGDGRQHTLRLRMTIRRLIVGVLLVAATLGFDPQAQACFCMAGSLEHRFETSDNVFTAIVTTRYVEPADERTPIRSLFRVTESFKGGTPFTALVSHSNEGTCGIDLLEGVEYLFFAPDSGEVSLCSGISTADRARIEIERLRSYVAGEVPNISVFWNFSRPAARECSLTTFLDIGHGFRQGHLRILASNERAEWSGGDPRFDFVELAIRSMHGASAPVETRSPLRLDVGGVEYAADWTAGRAFNRDIPGSNAVRTRLPGAYVLLGNTVEELLQFLIASDALVIRYDGQGFEPDWELEVNTVYLADAGSDMQKCIQNLRRDTETDTS